jgi:hypothetical protein
LLLAFGNLGFQIALPAPRGPASAISPNETLWNVGATMTAYSALMLAARTTLAHFPIWSAMNFPNSVDVNDIG